MPVGKLQSSFNIAGSWADMVTFHLFSPLQKLIIFEFEGSLALETDGGLVVFKSLPAKEPKVGVFSIQLYLFTKVGRLCFLSGNRVGRLCLTFETPEARQECLPSLLFAKL